VYKPVVDDGWSHGVNGAAFLYSITYDGSSLNMSGHILGYNPTKQDRDVTGKFRLTVKKNGDQQGQPVVETAPPDVLEQDESYGASGSPSKFIGMIKDGDDWTGDGYVRIFVGVATWNAVGSASFDKKDN